MKLFDKEIYKPTKYDVVIGNKQEWYYVVPEYNDGVLANVLLFRDNEIFNVTCGHYFTPGMDPNAVSLVINTSAAISDINIIKDIVVYICDKLKIQTSDVDIIHKSEVDGSMHSYVSIKESASVVTRTSFRTKLTSKTEYLPTRFGDSNTFKVSHLMETTYRNRKYLFGVILSEHGKLVDLYCLYKNESYLIKMYSGSALGISGPSVYVLLETLEPLEIHGGTKAHKDLLAFLAKMLGIPEKLVTTFYTSLNTIKIGEGASLERRKSLAIEISDMIVSTAVM